MSATSSFRPTLQVREKGARGPTLAFLHYDGGSSRTWTPIIDALPTDTRTLAVVSTGSVEPLGKTCAEALGGAGRCETDVLMTSGQPACSLETWLLSFQ